MFRSGEVGECISDRSGCGGEGARELRGRAANNKPVFASWRRRGSKQELQQRDGAIAAGGAGSWWGHVVSSVSGTEAKKYHSLSRQQQATQQKLDSLVSHPLLITTKMPPRWKKKERIPGT